MVCPWDFGNSSIAPHLEGVYFHHSCFFITQTSLPYVSTDQMYVLKISFFSFRLSPCFKKSFSCFKKNCRVISIRVAISVSSLSLHLTLIPRYLKFWVQSILLLTSFTFVPVIPLLHTFIHLVFFMLMLISYTHTHTHTHTYIYIYIYIYIYTLYIHVHVHVHIIVPFD